MKVPVNEPMLAKNAKKYVNECLDSNWISSGGKFVDLFESKFSDFIGMKYGVANTSGTASLHLAMLCLGIQKGDEVILPVHTMMSTAAAVSYVGAKPVFVDVDSETYNIDVSKIEEKISNKTKAILVVDLFGHPVDYDPILKLARNYHLKTIDDSAQSHGATYKGKMVGSMTDISCFSFYANKIITTGEGGMLLTNNKKFFEEAKSFRDLYHNKKHRFLHDKIGYNYRMTNLQAAIGLAQVEEIKKFLKIKKNMAKLYFNNLKGVEGIKLPTTKDYAESVFWMFTILIDRKKFGTTRDNLMNELKKYQIDSRTTFVSLNKQPPFRNLSKNKKFPISEYVEKTGLYLPSGLAITKKQIDYVCNCIKKIHKKYN